MFNSFKFVSLKELVKDGLFDMAKERMTAVITDGAPNMLSKFFN